MDVMDAIETRLDIREFADEPASDEDKRATLEAGRLAPSGRNLQHWRFLLVDDPDDLRRLADLSPSGGWVAGAAYAVVVLTDPEHGFHKLDAGRALTHMQLAAWERGTGSRIYTVDNPEVRAFLDVPNDLHLTAVLGFGRPVREIRGRKDRKPLDEVAFRGRFGEPVGL